MKETFVQLDEFDGLDRITASQKHSSVMVRATDS